MSFSQTHLAALIAGKTLALDVQSEYVLFVQAQTTTHQESTLGGNGIKHPSNQKGGCDG